MIGIDIVYIPKLKIQLKKSDLYRKFLTEDEIQEIKRRDLIFSKYIETIAGMIAAKEAVFKASAEKLNYRDIHIFRYNNKTFAKTLYHMFEVSISHQHEYAIASVIEISDNKFMYIKNKNKTKLVVYLDKIYQNALKIKDKTNKDIFAVVKANAYGLGAVMIARTLDKISSKFAVAILDEAIELRESGINKSILVLGAMNDSDIDYYINYNIIPTVFRLDSIDKLYKRATELKKKVKIHLAIDTGHSRIGFRFNGKNINELENFLWQIKNYNSEYFELEGMYSHFSCSDEIDNFNSHQLLLFNKAVGIAKNIMDIKYYHIANDGAILLQGEDTYFDAVRPGLGIYGQYPSIETQNKSDIKLENTFEWLSYISMIKRIELGDSVSYSRTFIAKRPTIVATVQVGYADGYKRCLSNKGEVCIDGVRCKIIGNICMDQMMVDITDHPNLDNIKVGDEVELLGKNIAVDEMAKKSDTINYEILVGISSRVNREYK